MRSETHYNSRYNILLLLLMVYTVYLLYTCWKSSISPDSEFPMNDGGRELLALVFCLLFCQVLTFAIRLLSVGHRRWATILLNFLILIEIPVGTLVGLYGIFNAERMIDEDRKVAGKRPNQQVP